MGYESTVVKSRKIRIYPDASQRAQIQRWFGVSRYVYNKTVEHLQQPGTKANWMQVKKIILAGLPDWAGEVPYQIKSLAVKDACDAVKAAKRRYVQGGGFSKVSFRSRKAPKQSIYIPKSAVKQKGVYIQLLGELRYAEAPPEDVMDCRLVFVNGRYYLSTPSLHTITQPDNQGRVISLDPGVRSFLTYYHEDGCGKLGEHAIGRITRLCCHLDDLQSRIDQAPSRQKRRMRKAAARLRNRIADLVDEMHWKCCRWLVDHFDIILLPTFETQQMVGKARRKLRKKSVRQLLTLKHFKFKQRLKQKAFECGKLVLDVNEAYTSKTVSWTGEIVKNLGSAKVIKSKLTQQRMDRDYNGARGILLRALVDSPPLLRAFVNNY
jgi:putative transposase